jgi:uncharacterized iron-regulated protein
VAALAALRPGMTLGFEAFPRRVQPVLDRWVAGEFTEQEFLKAVDWPKVWGYDAAHYLPLFHFARLNRIPMIALNVEPSLPRSVGERGLQAVPAEAREGIHRVAPPGEAYLEKLFSAYVEHPDKSRATRQDAEFRRFVEAQQVWDRAMAQAIAERLAREPGALVVGIMGSGHVSDGHGVPHQLRDLKVERVASLVPLSTEEECRKLPAGFATAVFAVPPSREKPAKPRLGISVETTPNGVRVASVMAGSLAQATGLRQGDILSEVAGTSPRQAGEIRPIVDSVAPGTWLPLKVLREAQTLELVVRFPREPRAN